MPFPRTPDLRQPILECEHCGYVGELEAGEACCDRTDTGPVNPCPDCGRATDHLDEDGEPDTCSACGRDRAVDAAGDAYLDAQPRDGGYREGMDRNYPPGFRH